MGVAVQPVSGVEEMLLEYFLVLAAGAQLLSSSPLQGTGGQLDHFLDTTRAEERLFFGGGKKEEDEDYFTGGYYDDYHFDPHHEFGHGPAGGGGGHHHFMDRGGQREDFRDSVAAFSITDFLQSILNL